MLPTEHIYPGKGRSSVEYFLLERLRQYKGQGMTKIALLGLQSPRNKGLLVEILAIFCHFTKSVQGTVVHVQADSHSPVELSVIDLFKIASSVKKLTLRLTRLQTKDVLSLIIWLDLSWQTHLERSVFELKECTTLGFLIEDDQPSKVVQIMNSAELLISKMTKSTSLTTTPDKESNKAVQTVISQASSKVSLLSPEFMSALQNGHSVLKNISVAEGHSKWAERNLLLNQELQPVIEQTERTSPKKQDLLPKSVSLGSPASAVKMVLKDIVAQITPTLEPLPLGTKPTTIHSLNLTIKVPQPLTTSTSADKFGNIANSSVAPPVKAVTRAVSFRDNSLTVVPDKQLYLQVSEQRVPKTKDKHQVKQLSRSPREKVVSTDFSTILAKKLLQAREEEIDSLRTKLTVEE